MAERGRCEQAHQDGGFASIAAALNQSRKGPCQASAWRGFPFLCRNRWVAPSLSRLEDHAHGGLTHASSKDYGASGRYRPTEPWRGTQYLRCSASAVSNQRQRIDPGSE